MAGSVCIICVTGLYEVYENPHEYQEPRFFFTRNRTVAMISVNHSVNLVLMLWPIDVNQIPKQGTPKCGRSWTEVDILSEATQTNTWILNPKNSTSWYHVWTKGWTEGQGQFQLLWQKSKVYDPTWCRNGCGREAETGGKLLSLISTPTLGIKLHVHTSSLHISDPVQKTHLQAMH